MTKQISNALPSGRSKKTKRTAKLKKECEETEDIWMDNVPDLEDEDEFEGRR